MPKDLVATLRKVLLDVCLFASNASGLKLRSYQEEVARAVTRSVIKNLGLSFVVMFPRQSGKNETQAQIEAYLLTLFSQTDAEMVKISPTWKPQSQNAMRRLERVLKRNLITRSMWSKESGYIFKVGNARIYFFSGDPVANIVGATARNLLQVDEAQDVQVSKYDKDIAPMAASANATRIFWGTAWTSKTLLARELQAALAAEKTDGIRRVFILTANQVGDEVPEYKTFVSEQVARLGRNHPMIKTQYFSETIDAEGGMFPPQRQALMRGTHPRIHAPRAGQIYALLIDVAGEDEGATSDVEALANPRRDLTALTIVEIDLSHLVDPLIKSPIYRVVDRKQWIGTKHTTLYAELRAQFEHWNARYLVVDATGVGAGLSSFLDKAFPGKVIPYVFNASTKSKLGWDFLAVVETGRFKDWASASGSASPHVDAAVLPSADTQETFFRQLDACLMEVVTGPDRKMKWGVPDGTRDPLNNEYLHDDLIISAALCSVLDEQEWAAAGPALIIQAKDPLDDLDQGF